MQVKIQIGHRNNTADLKDEALFEEEALKNVNERPTSGLEEEERRRNKKEGIEHPQARIFGKAIEAKPNKGPIPLKPMVERKNCYTEEETKQEEWEEYWTTSQPELYTKPKSRAPVKKTVVTHLIRNRSSFFCQ